MAIYRVQAPDGSILRIEGSDNATEQQISEFAASQFSARPKSEKPLSGGPGSASRIAALEANLPSVEDVRKNLGFDKRLDVITGAVGGASDIGATLLYPLDALGVTGMTNKERRASLGDFFKKNADPGSLAFKGGRLGANIAGTAGAGSILAKGAQAVGAAPKIVAALNSGGFSLGSPAAKTIGGKIADTALRAGAGAVTGGVSAGLVNPEDADTGAVIGGFMPGGVKLAGALGNGVKDATGRLTSHILGATTGTGAEAVRGAYQAGKSGATAFVENMRGKVPFDDVVDAAKAGLAKMRLQRAADYRSGMLDISKDKSVLEFKPILQAVDNVQSMGSYKGQQINKHASSVVDDLAETVRKWGMLKKTEYRTPEGLDALKQAVGDIRDTTQAGTASRRAADTVYNAIKDQITKQAPTYSNVMKGYSTASKTLREVEKTLSLGEGAVKDTTIRKLQSLTRNNAQTNYGNRIGLAKTLEESGGVDLFPSISGQAMNSWTPRGLVGALEKVGMASLPFLAPKALAVAPFTSPRLVGEAAYGLGRIAGGTGRAIGAGRQAIEGQLSPEALEAMLAALRTAPVVISGNQIARR